MINYKRMFLVLLFVDCAYMGFHIGHDISQIFLAIASAMLAYGMACILARKKSWMMVWFVFLAVLICQTAVTAKKGISTETPQGNTTGSVVGDIVYGFQEIPANIQQAGTAFQGARNGNYAGFESINYRLATMGILIPLLSISVLLRRNFREETDQEGLR